MKFNSELMRVARQSRGYSQAELSHRSGLSQGNISKIENGISDPPDDAVEKIAKALAFPVSFFFQAYQPFGLPAVSYTHMKLPTTPYLCISRWWP